MSESSALVDTLRLVTKMSEAKDKRTRREYAIALALDLHKAAARGGVPTNNVGADALIAGTRLRPLVEAIEELVVERTQ